MTWVWVPAEPTEARRPLKPAKGCKPDELAEAPPVPSAIAPRPDVTNRNSQMFILGVSAFCEGLRQGREAGTGREHLINHRHGTGQDSVWTGTHYEINADTGI